LAVFGSAARDDFDPERSDIDLRVEFDALAAVAYANNYFALRDAFIGLFGREVDLLSSPTIRNPHFKKELEESQVLLYARNLPLSLHDLKVTIAEFRLRANGPSQSSIMEKP
jgi:predicted nucleotidyltransferase